MVYKIFACCLCAFFIFDANASSDAPKEKNDDKLTRAEVLADLDIWHQAGLSFIPSPLVVVNSKNTKEYELYISLRNSKAYKDAVDLHMKNLQKQ